MIKSAKEVIVVADATKFGEVAFAHITSFSAIHKLVTDQPPLHSILLELNKAGVKIYLAQNSAKSQ
jgi:DeoR/GlpR family transcriptional regulator of sugar metabolism